MIIIIDQQAYPLWKMFSRLPYEQTSFKFKRTSTTLKDCKNAVKHKDKMLNEANIVTEFEDQKYTIDDEFKENDLIVTLYLKAKLFQPRTISTMKSLRSLLYPLYRMVREFLGIKMYESMV